MGFFFLQVCLAARIGDWAPWFISLSVMSWVLCDPLASRAVPNQRAPAVRYDARRPRSRQFWTAGTSLVSGERWKICFTQPIPGLFPGHANEILWRQATIWRRADPKSPRAAKASSSQRLICLRASVPAFPTRSFSSAPSFPSSSHQLIKLTLSPLFEVNCSSYTCTHLSRTQSKTPAHHFLSSSSSTVTGSSTNQHPTSLISRVTSTTSSLPINSQAKAQPPLSSTP
jgi:hypothetical protein